MKNIGVLLFALLVGVSPGLSHELVESEELRSEVVVVQSERQSSKRVDIASSDSDCKVTDDTFIILETVDYTCDFAPARLYLVFQSLKLCE